MVDVLSTTAGVIQVAGFALEGVRLLHETLWSYKNSSKTIESIVTELEALSELLKSLEAVVEEDTELLTLQVPLKHCGTVCRDFQKLMSKIARKPGQEQHKIRGWMKLQSKGQDIRSFKDSLDMWRATISIAIGGANLSVSLSALISYAYLRSLGAMLLSPPEFSRNIKT